jgi:DNA-binding response OmpR family regulator
VAVKRVIVVEDHSAFAQALELVLEKREGAEVILARKVEEGRALIRGDGRPDLVVLDLMLPDGDGAELVEEVRRRHPGTPVAILSAREDVAEAASRAGADEAIRKDTPLPRIISSFERLIG